MTEVPIGQWFKAKNGKSWHYVENGLVICGNQKLLQKPMKYGPRDFPARDAIICKGCLYALADDQPDNLIGTMWWEQPNEADLEDEE